MELLKLAKNIKDVLSVSICRMKVIAKTEQPIITVSDIVTGISSAHTEKMKPPMHLHYKNISLYMVYDRYKKKRLGRCYAVKIGERYYGGFIGKKLCFSCSPKRYALLEVSYTFLTLKANAKEKFCLLCLFDAKNKHLLPVRVVKVDLPKGKRHEVARFAKGYSLESALECCREWNYLSKE